MATLTAKQFTDLATPVSLATITQQAVTPNDLLDKFKAYWPVAKGALSTIKIFTGDQVDKIIDKIIEGGDAIVGQGTGTISAKIKNFCSLWQNVRSTVSGIAQFIPGKAGAVLRDFIKVVDLICCEYGFC
jgi:hypothetical protein